MSLWLDQEPLTPNQLRDIEESRAAIANIQTHGAHVASVVERAHRIAKLRRSRLPDTRDPARRIRDAYRDWWRNPTPQPPELPPDARGREIRNLDTGEVFPSLSHVYAWLLGRTGTRPSVAAIRGAARHRGRTNGYRWEYTDPSLWEECRKEGRCHCASTQN